MNEYDLARLKRVNAAAAAQKQSGISPLAFQIACIVLGAVGCFAALSAIAKAAGLSAGL